MSTNETNDVQPPLSDDRTQDLGWAKSKAGAVHTALTWHGSYMVARCEKAGRFYLSYQPHRAEASHVVPGWERIGGGATLAKLKERAWKHAEEKGTVTVDLNALRPSRQTAPQSVQEAEGGMILDSLAFDPPPAQNPVADPWEGMTTPYPHSEVRSIDEEANIGKMGGGPPAPYFVPLSFTTQRPGPGIMHATVGGPPPRFQDKIGFPAGTTIKVQNIPDPFVVARSGPAHPELLEVKNPPGIKDWVLSLFTQSHLIPSPQHMGRLLAMFKKTWRRKIRKELRTCGYSHLAGVPTTPN